MRVKLFLRIFLLIFFLFVSVTCDKLCGLGFARCPGLSECCPTASPYYCSNADRCYTTHAEAAQHCSNESNITKCD